VKPLVKKSQHKHRKSHLQVLRARTGGVKGLVAATAVMAAAGATTVGVDAWAASGSQADASSAVTRLGPMPGAAVVREGKPAGQVLAQVQRHNQKVAAKAAREARQRKAASRAADRIVRYDADPRGLARSVMSSRYGWGAGEFSCLSTLWDHESGWNVHASNSSSGAYGIPQALPGSKMSTYGSDWRDNPLTQIEWGLAYIHQSYGTPCGALSAWNSKGWY
jgi:hypothetical protein